MIITLSKTAAALRISLTGKLDNDGAVKLRKKLSTHNLSQVELVVFDFTNLDYLSSHGIGTLTEIYKKIEPHDGKLHIRNASPDIKKLLFLIKLQKIFTIT